MQSSTSMLDMKKSTGHAFAVKIHLSDALGLLMIVGVLTSTWLLTFAAVVAWVVFYMSPLGRPVWSGSCDMLLYLASIPMLLAPAAALSHFKPELVPAALVVGGLVWIFLYIKMLPKIRERLRGR